MGAREDRIRNRYFPNVQIFDPSKGNYTSIPFVLRRMQFLFEPRAWQIFVYILMRIGPSGIGWMQFSELAWDLDFKSISKLRPYVDKLVKDGWLMHTTTTGKEYFVAPDPLLVIRQMHAAGRLPDDRVDAIDELLTALALPPLGDPGAASGKDTTEVLDNTTVSTGDESSGDGRAR